MGKISEIMEILENAMYSQFKNGVDSVDTREMGSVVDIYKDLADAKYHCVLVKAMEENGEYNMDVETYQSIPSNVMRQIDHNNGIAYYSESPMVTKYGTIYADLMDDRSGTPEMRMRKLEAFLSDVWEMLSEVVDTSTEEEKNLIRNKLTVMINKI